MSIIQMKQNISCNYKTRKSRFNPNLGFLREELPHFRKRMKTVNIDGENLHIPSTN